LPWDVLLHIFQLSDVPTLAVLGRVSLDFLVATSPLLYREVEITSLGQLEKLFCERKEKKVNSLSSSDPSFSFSPLLLPATKPDFH